MTLEERLKGYSDREVEVKEEKILKTIEVSKMALYQGEAEGSLSGFAFIFWQAGFIQKRWWFAQALILGALWVLLYVSGGSFYMQRYMGILTSLFAILLIPELWKNQNYGAMEIEGAAYFSIRKIYTARMLLFTLADILMLSMFFVAAAFTVKLTVGQIVVQFFLPMNVTCCICFGNLCSSRTGSYYRAWGMSLLWIAVWMLIIMKEDVYKLISVPVWAGAVAFSVLYLIYCVYRTWKNCGQYWEVNPSWS